MFNPEIGPGQGNDLDSVNPTEAQRIRAMQEEEGIRRRDYEPLVRVPRVMSVNMLLPIIDFFEDQDGLFRNNYEGRQINPSIERITNEDKKTEVKGIYDAAEAVHYAWLVKEQSGGTLKFTEGPQITPEQNGYFRQIPGVKEAMAYYMNDEPGGLAEFLPAETKDGNSRPVVTLTDGAGRKIEQLTDGTFKVTPFYNKEGKPEGTLPFTTRYAEGLRTTDGENAITNIVTYATFLGLAKKYFGVTPDASIDENMLKAAEDKVMSKHNRPEDQVYAFRNGLLRQEARLKVLYQNVYNQLPNYGEKIDYDKLETGDWVDPQEERMRELYDKLYAISNAEADSEMDQKKAVAEAYGEILEERRNQNKTHINIYQKLTRLQQQGQTGGYNLDTAPKNEQGANWAHELSLLAERSQRRAERLLTAECVLARLNPGRSKVLNPQADDTDLMFGEDRRKDKVGKQDVGVYDTIDRIFSPDPNKNPLICTKAHPDLGQYATDYLHHARSVITGETAWEVLQSGEEPKWGEMERPAQGSWFFAVSVMGGGESGGFYGGYIQQKDKMWADTNSLPPIMRSETFFLDLQQRINWFINLGCPITRELVYRNGIDAMQKGITRSERWQLDRNGEFVDTSNMSPSQLKDRSIRSTRDIEHGLKFLVVMSGIAKMSKSWLNSTGDNLEKGYIPAREVQVILKIASDPNRAKILTSPGKNKELAAGAFIEKERLERVGLTDLYNNLWQTFELT